MPSEIALPTLRRHANFHPLSGLITSPRPAPIPDLTSEDLFDYTRPRKLSDTELYLAFYPRARDKEGFIFGCLNVPNPVLATKVGQDPDIPGSYRLSWDLTKKWNELENTLISIATRLLSGHPQSSQFPTFYLPRMPARYGYVDLHPTKTAAYSAARRSRDAFPFLIALVSFAFSLWLTHWQHDCLERASQHLLDQGVPGPFLDLLKSSIVCDFAPGLRPGAFLDPYLTLWGPFFHRFTRANVPIWFLWGSDVKGHRTKPLADPKMAFYYPPDNIVHAAVKRSTTHFSAIPLPVPVGQYTSSTAAATASISPDPGFYFDQDVIDYDGGMSDYDGGMTDYGGGAMDVDEGTMVVGGGGSEAVDGGNSEAVDGGNSEAVEGGNSEAAGRGGSMDETPVSQEAEAPILTLAEREARRAIVKKDSDQRPGETHQAFFIRYMEARDRYLRDNSPGVKKQREERLRDNKTWYTHKSLVYTWERDEVDPSFWRRRLLSHAERQDDFPFAESWQRHYWVHKNAWDLMMFMEDPPEGYQKPTFWQNNGDDDDDGDDDEDPHTFLKKPIPYVERTPIKRLEMLSTDHLSAAALSIVREACQMSFAQPQEYTIPFRPLGFFLLERFGFDVDDPIASAGELDKISDKARETAFTAAIRTLGYSRAPTKLLEMSAAAKLATASFAGSISKAPLKDVYKGVWWAWDVNSDFKSAVQGLRVQLVSCNLESARDKALYVLRPPRHLSNWFVATRSATVVLLVFRKGWASSEDIARGLLELGYRFNTVIERKKTEQTDQPSKTILPSEEASLPEDASLPPEPEDRGEEALGVRTAGFVPNSDDFKTYLAARRQVLLGPTGRALRLLGGVIGRIAAEVVTDERVLMGPTLCNNVVGVSGDNEYVDDGASTKDLNIIIGLYVIPDERKQSKRSALRSWYPSQVVWENYCGYFDEQWLPDAENWYTFEFQKFVKGQYSLKRSSEWKSKLKFGKADLVKVHTENEEMSANFIKTHLLV